MDIRKLQRAIVDGLEDVKAQHIAVFNTEHLSSLFERVIIASGTSNRQTKALAASVRDSVKSRGMQVMATEGEDNGEWIIVDCGAAVAHIMQPAIREYYHLEEIWGGKSVRMKVGEVNTKLVKASEPSTGKRAQAPRSAARHAATKPVTKAFMETAAKPAEKKAPLKKKPTAFQIKENSTKKFAARAAEVQRVATQPPARKAAAKRSSPRPGAAASPPARKAPARASPVRTVVVKTAQKPARKATGTTAKVAAKTPAKKPSKRSA